MKYERKVSSDFRKYLKSEMDYWLGDGLISSEQKDKITEIYSLNKLGKETFNTLIWVIYILAAALIGVGVISFVAAHWDDISKPVKLTLLFGAMLASYIGGFYLWQIDGRCKKLGHSLVILGTIIFGANIGLVAQIFHIQSRPYNAFGAWAIGAMLIAYSVNSVPNAIIAIITSFIFFAGDLEHLLWWGDYEPLTLYPIIAVAVFMPFAYRNKSVLTFILLLLAISISVIVITMTYDIAPDFLRFTAAVIGVAALMLGWGLMSLATKVYKNFGGAAVIIGTVFMLFIIYLLSFLDIAEELFKTHYYTNMSISFENCDWLIPLAGCYALGIPMYLVGMVRIKGIDFVGIFSRVLFVLILIVLCAILLTVIFENHIIAVAVANAAFAVCGIVFLIFSFKSELRSLFWIGVLIFAVMVISRSLEYDTELIVKAIAFIGSGVGLLAGGIVFEKFLKKRRLADA